MDNIQYFNSLKRFKLYQKRLDSQNISRIYFGEELCEEMIPSNKEVEYVYQWCRAKKAGFTFVTGIVTQKALGRIRIILDLLHAKNDNIEVVFSDWGILRIMEREKYPNFIPVLGRLLIKTPRAPRFVDADLHPASRLIPSDKLKRICDRQMHILKSSNLSVLHYRDFLKTHGINRIEIDPVSYGQDLEAGWGFAYSLYTPFSYVTSGRVCDLAGFKAAEKARYVTSKPCSKVCERFYLKLSYKGGDVYQFGNGIFMKNDYFLKKCLETKLFDRLVIQNFL